MKVNKETISVYTALFANLAIAIVKFIAAIVTRSSSMFTEGIHSVVDTFNQILLLIGVRRSKKLPDAHHPFGHGMELYFWALVVGILIFGLGGLMSIFQGILRIQNPEEIQNILWNYLVIGASYLFDGISLYVSVKNFRTEYGKGDFFKKLKSSKDPALFVVIYEDFSDLLGITIALAGITLSHFLHEPLYDGIASVAIGVSLILISIILIAETRKLLLGESANKAVVNSIYKMVKDDTEVNDLDKPLTMHLSAHEILLALKVSFRHNLSSAELANATSRIESEIKNQFPDVTKIFLEAKISEKN